MVKRVRYRYTEKDATATIADLTRLLSQHGVLSIQQEWEGEQPVLIRFTLLVEGRPFPAVLRAPIQRLAEKLPAQQAVRTAWRRVYYLVEQVLLASEDRAFPVWQLLLGFAEVEDPDTGMRTTAGDLWAHHARVGPSGAARLLPPAGGTKGPTST
jgi:hypothetical protein